MKKIIALLLAVMMCVGLFAGCGDSSSNPSTQPSDSTGTSTPTNTPGGTEDGTAAEYTYHTAATSLGTNWNPHTWEYNTEGAMIGYMSTSLWTSAPLDSENSIYQYVLVGAESVTDVTAEYQSDLIKYNVNLQEGKTAETTTEGFVHQIKLREDLCWEDGTPINADTFMYSIKQQLSPEMRNYRGSLGTGDGAIAGADAYYTSGMTTWTDAAGSISLDDVTITADGAALADGTVVGIGASFPLAHLDGGSLYAAVNAEGGENLYDIEAFAQLYGKTDANGGAPLNTTTYELIKKVITAKEALGETEDDIAQYLITGVVSEVPDYDETVGYYKVDDYTLNLVTLNYLTGNDFFYYASTPSLVYEPYYEAGKDTTGALVSTDYNSKPENTMSWGPYRMESYQDGRQVVFTQNPNWWGWEEQADGSLVAYTPYEVDGEHVRWYMTTKIVIDVMDESAQKQAFLKGEIDEWLPTSDDLTTYNTSDQLYRAPQNFAERLFLNTNLAALKEMDASKGNTNSVVMSNTNFRKAFSLGIDRAEFAAASAGWDPLYTLISKNFYVNMLEDPSTRFRDTDAAMQALCDLYDIEYGEGTAYATLRDAYQSVNGYNLTEAQNLMKQAHDELVSAGLYKSGDEIVIRIAWAKGSLTSTDHNLITLLNKYINAAAEGSGFGKITLEGVDNVSDRYGDVPKGEFAMGWGAWSSGVAQPYGVMTLYMDPDNSIVQEVGNYDPRSNTVTLSVNGVDRTETWQWWSNAMTGSGEYGTESDELKCDLTAQLERKFLEQYWCIPIACTNTCTLVSYKLDYYTDTYNTLYGYGGISLMQYAYSDAEWSSFLSEIGSLSYE